MHFIVVFCFKIWSTMAFCIAYLCQQQEDRNIPPKKHHEIPFLRGGILRSSLPPRTAFWIVALWPSLTDQIRQTQEEHGVLRTNIMKYRLWGGMPCSSLPPRTPFWIVALWLSRTDQITQTEEEHGVLRTNIMKYRLWGVCRALPII